MHYVPLGQSRLMTFIMDQNQNPNPMPDEEKKEGENPTPPTLEPTGDAN